MVTSIQLNTCSLIDIIIEESEMMISEDQIRYIHFDLLKQDLIQTLHEINIDTLKH